MAHRESEWQAFGRVTWPEMRGRGLRHAPAWDAAWPHLDDWFRTLRGETLLGAGMRDAR
jgi:hypothetical protein